MEVSHIEDAIAKTGWGLYSRFLLIYCGLCLFSMRLASLSMPLYLPLIICDMPLCENAAYLINIGLPIGVIMGGFTCSVSDVVGRRTAITFGLLMCFVNELSISFAYNTLGLIVSQVVLGIGLTVGEGLIKIHVAECIPASRRAKSLIFLDIFGSCGNIFAIVISMLCLPMIRKYQTHNTRIITWRMIFCLPGLFSIVLACMSALVLESPRYLLYERRMAAALGTLKEIYAINNSKMFFQFTVTERDLQGKIADFGINGDRGIPNNINTKQCIVVVKRAIKSTGVVFKYFFDVTFLLALCRLFSTMGPFVLSMLLVKTLETKEDFYIESLDVLHFEHPVLRSCDDNSFEYTFFWEFLVFQAAYTLGLSFSACMTSFIDRKHMIFSGLFTSGLSTSLLTFIYRNYCVRFAISGLAMMSFGMFQACLNVITVEVYPTAVRGTGYGNTLVFSKFLDIFLCLYLGLPCSWLFIAFSLMMEVGALLSFGLPRMKDRPMVD